MQKCNVDGCARRVHCGSMCGRHYIYFVRHGSLDSYNDMKNRYARNFVDLKDFILSKVVVGDECWLWEGPIDGGGYGVFSKDHKTHVAHRVSYEVFISPIPSGKVLDHLCETKSCINPFHLEPVSIAENVRRGLINKYGTHTRCTRGHIWSSANTRIDKKGHRKCVECSRVSMREYRVRLLT